MSKRKPLDKAEARQRRDQMLASAAAARLSITEGVREMRAIAGMTQDEFARHREVSARVIKAIELGQGNPTLATMNQIGRFFGLEVAFVPMKRAPAGERRIDGTSACHDHGELLPPELARQTAAVRESIAEGLRMLNDMLAGLNLQTGPAAQEPGQDGPAIDAAPSRTRKKPPSK